MQNIELKDLRSFIVVAEEKSFSKAAARLFVAQSALSVRIKDLEMTLGVKLFNRTTRSVKLNEAGEVFFAEAGELLLKLSQAVAATKSAGAGESGILRIGYTKRASYFLLPELLRRLSTEQPTLRLDIHNPLTTGDLYARVLGGELDIALTYFRDKPDKLLQQAPLTESELVVVLPSSHSLGKEQEVNLSDFKDEQFVAYPSTGGYYLRSAMDSMCHEAGFKPFVVKESSDTQALICFVATGRYVSILPHEVTDYALEGVSYKKVKSSSVYARHGAIWLKSNNNPSVPFALTILNQIVRNKNRNSQTGVTVGSRGKSAVTRVR